MLAHPIATPSAAPNASDDGRVSDEHLENPRIPPPPRLGSLGDLAPRVAADSEVEPEPYAKPDAAESALDTSIEGGMAKRRTRDADDDDLDLAPQRRSGATVVLTIAIGSLLVALALLAFALLKR
jgi:hypothetical protein